MPKKANPNSISRSPRAAKKKPVVKRGFGDWWSEAYRCLNLLMFVHNNIDNFKSLFDHLIQ
jgi:hypothetical protein